MNATRGIGHSIVRVLLTAMLGALTNAGVAADLAIDDVRLSKSGNVATAEILLGCPMRYLDHAPRRGGSELAIRLSLSSECRRSLGGVRSELRRPPGGHLAQVEDLEFEMSGLDEATVTVRFRRPVGFTVSQRGLGNLVQVRIDTRAEFVAPEAVPSAEPAISAVPRTLPPREPMQVRRVSPGTAGDNYVLVLASLEQQAEVPLSALAIPDQAVPYLRPMKINGSSRQELRVGFFDSEAAAQAALAGLRNEWPDAWIAVASPDEHGEARDARGGALGVEPGPTATAPGITIAMAQDEVLALMAEGKAALLDQDYDRSIRIYTRMLEVTDHGQRPEAQELLGVAREKKGQFAHAKAEYEAYLAQFADAPGAARVEQRLAALVGVSRPQNGQLRQLSRAGSDRWEAYGGFSQFYRRNVNQFHESSEETVNQSALISRADLVVRRRGQRFDLLGRMNAGYYYDMLSDGRGTGDQGLLSYAYVDIVGNDTDFAARLGRQTRYSGGVLGRFDGAHVSYGWKPNLIVNLTAGFPVDSPRHVTNTDHVAYGASVDFKGLAEYWDVSLFFHQQRLDGISDREAIGAEASFALDDWSLVSVADYDVSYNVLNSWLVAGNWRATDRLTINARLNVGASPFLTTRNALIGQPVATLEELLQIYTEPQVRRLARNRTAETQSASLGFSTSLGDRWYWNTDFSYSEYGATVESGGVSALPETGAQFFVNSNLVGSSLFRSGDTAIVGLRYNSTRTADTSTVILDLRYPATDGLRINPRLAFSFRQSAGGDADQWIASPVLRLIYRWRRRYRLEFEAGGNWSTGELVPTTVPGLVVDDEETSAYFLNLGYLVEF
ncbi:MAG: tetratricopeptide repeat protein [Gammaproteobacteria bacterium]|nr:tetratricopeptide repeat protein [Gammaproteobacteria bacterium]